METTVTHTVAQLGSKVLQKCLHPASMAVLIINKLKIVVIVLQGDRQLPKYHQSVLNNHGQFFGHQP